MPKTQPKVDMATEVVLPKLDKIELGEYALDIDYFLKTDYQGGAAASKEIPAIIEWVNSELQIAIEKKIITKQAMKKAAGAAFLDLRGPALWERRGYAGKQTEGAIEAAVNQEDSVTEATETFAYWSGLVSRLNNTLISLQAKLDLVRTTEATRRALVDEDDQTRGDC
jgi:hypothetical protein